MIIKYAEAYWNSAAGLSYDVTSPAMSWHWPAAHFRHFHVSTSLTWPTSKLYSSHARPPTWRSCSLAGSCYVGPPMVASNMLRNIQTEAALPAYLDHPRKCWQWVRGVVCSSKQRKPLTHQLKDFSNESTWRYSRETSVYYTRELYFPRRQQCKVALRVRIQFARFYDTTLWHQKSSLFSEGLSTQKHGWSLKLQCSEIVQHPQELRYNV